MTGFHMEKQGNTAVLTLDNPPANTWTLESLNHLSLLISELEQETAITALVIKSNSDKFFSAGADLKLFDKVPVNEVRAMADAFGQAFEALTNFRGVTIAAINGYAMGGGLEVALACDIRLLGPSAKMALPEAKVGLLPCAGGTQNLTALVGEGWAKRMILFGDIIDANTAVRIGLSEELTEEPVELAMQMAAKTAAVSPDSLSACKKLIQMGRTGVRWDNLSKERELFMALFNGSNQQEGVDAFLEKRKPQWQY